MLSFGNVTACRIVSSECFWKGKDKKLRAVHFVIDDYRSLDGIEYLSVGPNTVDCAHTRGLDLYLHICICI